MVKQLQIKRKKKVKESSRKAVHCIVKRFSGVCQRYDERKVYGSVYAACYVVRMAEQECERVANAVARKVTELVHVKKSLGSHQIAALAAKELRKYNEHAAFMYETHRDVS